MSPHFLHTSSTLSPHFLNTFSTLPPHFLHTFSTLSALVFCVEHASFHFTILHTSPHLSPHFSTLFLHTKLHTFLHLHTDFHTSPHLILHTKCGESTPFTSHSGATCGERVVDAPRHIGVVRVATVVSHTQHAGGAAPHG